ncbi:MAG: hypothetical protein IPG96_11480 [Proteobacteria bacterium]|nr:hypothetical protein [Pseudomonadota bacterium]
MFRATALCLVLVAASCKGSSNDCSPNPCQGGGTCVADLAGFSCRCPAGYAGKTCELDIDDCSPNPCKNGGDCSDGVAGFNCRCPAGYAGATCTSSTDDCSPDPCRNGGTCVDGSGGFTCVCPDGFAGATCSSCAEGYAGAACTRINGGVVSTLAGIPGEADGEGRASSFQTPFGLAFDSSGNLFVSDYDGAKLRKISPAGEVMTVAGSTPGTADGTGTAAQFYWPQGVAVDAAGNVYVAGNYDNRIRKVTPDGRVSTIIGMGSSGYADGPAAEAQFRDLRAVAVGRDGQLYAADQTSVRKITPDGYVSTLAGSGTNGSADGTGAAAGFFSLFAIALDAADNVYVADASNNRIRKITPTGVVTSIGSSAGLNNPRGVAVDADGNVYASGSYNHKIHKFTPADLQTGTVLAGGQRGYLDGVGTDARFGPPYHLAVRGRDLFVADRDNRRIRKIDTTTGAVTTAYGSGSPGYLDGTGRYALFNQPHGVARDASGNLYVTDSGNNRIRKVTPNGEVTTLAGSGSSGHLDGVGTAAQFSDPQGIAFDGQGSLVVADQNNSLIRKVTLAGVVSTLAGDRSNTGLADGLGPAARFDGPDGVAIDSAGNIYVADAYNHCIRKVSAAGVVTTLAGTGSAGYANGAGATAQFNTPGSVAIDHRANLYVADVNNKRIRRIDPAGTVTTVATMVGNAWLAGDVPVSTPPAGRPAAVAVDAGDNLYIADATLHTITRIEPAAAVATLVGSVGRRGYLDGVGTKALIGTASGMVIDAATNLYMVDSLNHNVRVIR